MRVVCRSAVITAAALFALTVIGTSAHAAITINKCNGGKIKCAAGRDKGLAKCDMNPDKKGLAIDPNCTNKAIAKYTGGTAPAKGCFAKLEAKPPCETTGDSTALSNKVDAFLADLFNELDLDYPTAVLDKCAAGKEKCGDGYGQALLKCYNKQATKGVVDAVCLSKAVTKYTGGTAPAKGCFAKLEAKGGCATLGDSAAIKAKVEAYVNDIICELKPDLKPDAFGSCVPPTCPNQIVFTGTSTTGVLDTGWKGFGHDATVISKGAVTVTATCGPSTPPCGVCAYSGPVANAAGLLPSQRCTNDSSKSCTVGTEVADCGGAGLCKFYFGTYLPLAAGGVATCVENIFKGPISGTANIESGASAGAATLTSKVYTATVGVSQPCPRCNGDTTANDGVRNGTCDTGVRAGLLCDASGSSPFASTWGTTSLDCAPLASLLTANLTIDLSSTTGNKTRTLSATNPVCRAPGFGGLRCQCDTCNDLAQEACSSNADCPDGPDAPGAGVIGAICGGKRCVGGGNAGMACTASGPQCPGGTCDVPGAQTKPNDCDDVVCTLVAKTCIGGTNNNWECTVDSECPGGTCKAGNEGVCAGGPFTENYCGPTETYKGCTTNAQCTFPGDTCSLNRLRDCFDSGLVGDVVTASGLADAPSGHQSDPILASMFCVGPTSNPAVNGAAGLPGLGRLELQGHAVDNGTP